MKVLIFICMTFFAQLAIAQDMSTLVAKKQAKKESKWKVTFQYQTYTSGGFYNSEGKIITESPRMLFTYDSLGGKKDSILGRYTFDNNWDIYEIGAEYQLDSNLTLEAQIPIYHRTFKEQESYKRNIYDQNGQVVYVEDVKLQSSPQFSRTDIYALRLNSKYIISTNRLKSDIKVGLIIPFGGQKGTALTASNPFLNDGFTSLFVQSNIHYLLFSDIGVATGFGYTMNGENISNYYNAEIAITYNKVESSSLMAFAKWQAPTSNTIQTNFNVREFPTQELFLSAGVGFNFKQKGKFSVDITYQHRISGKNTWNYGLFSVLFGLYL